MLELRGPYSIRVAFDFCPSRMSSTMFSGETCMLCDKDIHFQCILPLDSADNMQYKVLNAVALLEK